jgi:hypothetical protein
MLFRARRAQTVFPRGAWERVELGFWNSDLLYSATMAENITPTCRCGHGNLERQNAGADGDQLFKVDTFPARYGSNAEGRTITGFVVVYSFAIYISAQYALTWNFTTKCNTLWLLLLRSGRVLWTSTVIPEKALEVAVWKRV